MKALAMILAAWTFLVRLVLCKILHVHRNKVERVSFFRLLGQGSKGEITRYWVRKTQGTCSLCHQPFARSLKRRVAHDWQYPERLFPKGG